MSITIDVDSRGRAGLGKVLRPGTYRATTRDDGSVLLEPAHVVTEAELAVLRNPALTASLEAALAGRASGVEFDWRA